MKKSYLLLLASTICCLSLTACSKSDPGEGQPKGKPVTMTPDNSSLLRNPAMGWTLYDDAYDEVANADVFWQSMDRYAREYASNLYIRWRWSELESSEGVYAWDDPGSNFSKLIDGARERGLRISMRIFYDSGDNIRQATPQYVRDAGAQGYTYQDDFVLAKLNDYDHGSFWSPFPDDPVFREKYDKFIQALAQKFDDPSFVDYIDALALGLWGECWFVPLSDRTIGWSGGKNMSEKHKETFTWMTDTYSKYFKNILLCFNFLADTDFDFQVEEAINKKGYVLRRDGLGGGGFKDEITHANSVFPKVCFFAESYYWMINQPYNPNNDYYKADPVYGNSGNGQYKTWRDVLIQTYNHAIDARANTLDMREIGEAMNWDINAKDYVQNFILRGGYRFFPTELYIPEYINRGESFTIEHSWTNKGVGILPNHNPRWNYKYKPAFALISNDQTIAKTFVDKEAEPSSWLLGKDSPRYKLSANAGDIAAGQYRLGIAIVDTSDNNKPGIKIATTNQNINGWYIIDTITVK